MGVHNLVVGLNGSGKTLYTVAAKLLPLSTATISYKGKDIPRRLCVGGIPSLAIPHEVVEVPEIDPETFEDTYGSIVRERGDPPVRFVRLEVVNSKTGMRGYVKCEEGEPNAEPMLWTALCWWAWCEPGDVIVLDECQRLFRPMASGRKVPRFISRLETARHYGVEFIYLTQYPALLHSNVRSLVGPIEDISRVFGSSRVLVREWDRMGDFGKKQLCTTHRWKHDKKAFGLYKSSELHTNFRQRLPLAVWGMAGGFAALLGIGGLIWHRLHQRFEPSAPVAIAAPLAGGGVGSGGGAAMAHRKR